VAQWVNKALDEVRISTAAKARREYNNLKDEYIKAEAEAADASKKAEQNYHAAMKELAAMPRRGRPSVRKLELVSFIAEYEATQSSENSQPKLAGRPKKVQLTPEHEASLKELSDRINDFKGAKFALGHNPENCTENQIEKLQLIENNYPDLYRAYQLKESLRLILHMKDPEQAAIELAKWIDDARNSGLKSMQKLADKIDTLHKENILNAIKCQANSAKSESTNTTIKGLIKLARGFRTIDNMIALIYLKCSDIVVPLCNRPQPSAEWLARKRARANELRRLREERRRMEAAS
jgi:transposase